jgi:hypothetical protein
MSVREEWEMECPKCRDDSHIFVSVKVLAHMLPDGSTDTVGDQEWDEESDCQCSTCGHQGRVADFKIEAI